MVIGGNYDAYAYYRPVQYQGNATYADPRFGNRASSMTEPEVANGTFPLTGPGAAKGTSGVTDPEAAKGTQKPTDQEKVKKPGRRSSPEECETCKERKYQDGSDENVSFKSAQHISPESAASRVRAHEAEHVANAYSKAAKDGGKVVNASVSIHTATCPECGRVYVSGGTTHTRIEYPNETNPYQQERKAQDALKYTGANINYVA